MAGPYQRVRHSEYPSRVRLTIVAVVLMASSATASAGRTYYGWLWGTEVMPERGAELMTWVAEQNDLDHEGHASQTQWWVGPLIGITDQLELALPFEIAWDRVPGMPGKTAFDRYGAELRYRLVSSDPVDAPALVPLVRVAVKRIVTERDKLSPEVDFVLSYETGDIHMLVDLGGYGELTRNSSTFELRPGAGISVRALGALRFGAEAHAEISLDNTNDSWAVIGPNMAWSHGRSWLSAAYGIGVYGVKDAPKVQWGIAF
jgi:hypothetical protein